jgi:glycosyltransferase involved in cell wall biosynthesis
VKISIVTVCFNAAATIADTLESVARQTHPDVEHIVVDGASTDGTMDIVRRYAGGLTRVVSEPDRGIYDAMNKGLALAGGEIVTFLNADDVFAAADIIERVALLMADPALDACYADLVYVGKDDPNRVVRYWKSRPYAPGLCLKGWMPAHPTFFVRKAVLDRHGGFDTAFRLQSDFDLMVRLFELHHIRTHYVPEIWVRMRMGGASNKSLANVWQGNLEAWRSCRKHGFAVSPFFMVRKIASRFPQYFFSNGFAKERGRDNP